MKDLNDLRFIAAVARTGSLSGAARQLKVNHATAFRRIAKIEEELKIHLFDRDSGRYLATPAGEALAKLGDAIELQAEESIRQLHGEKMQPAGVVRITTTDSIASLLIGPMLRICQQELPNILLQVVTANDIYNLSKRDADIAIRPTAKPPEHLSGSRICTLAMAIYGSKAYLRQNNSKDLAEHRWITLDDSLSQTGSVRWLARLKPLETVYLRTNSFPAISHACTEGVGLAVMPCFIGDRASSLVRVSEPLRECQSAIWLLTHPELRTTARVGSAFEIFERELIKMSDLISGQLGKKGA